MSEDIARGLGDLMRQAEEALAAESATAPADVVAHARRRRRRSTVTAVAFATAAVVTLSIAGIGLSRGGGAEPVPSFTPSPSPVPSEDLSVPLASTVIPIDVGPDDARVTALLECGAPAPEPTGTVDHFAVTIAEPGPLTLPSSALISGAGVDVETWITYDATDPLPAAQLPVMLALVKDGKVAGTFEPDYAAQRYWTYSDQGSYYGGSTLMPAGNFCPEVSTEPVPDSGYRVLDPGDYQVQPVTRVWASEEAAALKYLYTKGITVIEFPPDQPYGDLTPGSWDCKRFASMNASTRSCLGDVTSIAIVDATGGTVTLPYEPEQFTRATDVVLVGDPVDLSIPEPIEVPDRSGFEMVSLDVSEPLECGVRFDYIAWDSPFTADGRMPREFGDGANSANARVLVAKMGTGTVALANDAVAWITGPVANDYNYFPDHPGNRQILGVADVSVAGGNTFAYDRYKGPVAVDFVFTNVAWCDGAEPEWGVDSVIIDGDVAVTPTGQPPVALAPALIEFADYGSGE